MNKIMTTNKENQMSTISEESIKKHLKHLSYLTERT